MHLLQLLFAICISLDVSLSIPISGTVSGREASPTALGLPPFPYPPGFGPSTCRRRPGVENPEIENTTATSLAEINAEESLTLSPVGVIARCQIFKTADIVENRESFLNFPPQLIQDAGPDTKWSFTFSCSKSLETVFILGRNPWSQDVPDSYRILKSERPNRKSWWVGFELGRPFWVKTTMYFEGGGDQHCEMAIMKTTFERQPGEVETLR